MSAAAEPRKEARDRVRELRLMVFDVDGVLTDGSLYYDRNGEALKRFNVLDGHGIKALRAAGMLVGIVSGRDSEIVTRRAEELGVDALVQGAVDKAESLRGLLERFSLLPAQAGFMGDDVIDLPAMEIAGFAASVPNAPRVVRARAHWVASRPGGAGAARECCDFILTERERERAGERRGKAG